MKGTQQQSKARWTQNETRDWVQTQLVPAWGLTFGSSHRAMIHFKGNSHCLLHVHLPAFPFLFWDSWLLVLSSFILSCPSLPTSPRGPFRQKPGLHFSKLCVWVTMHLSVYISTCQHMRPARNWNFIYFFSIQYFHCCALGELLFTLKWLGFL